MTKHSSTLAILAFSIIVCGCEPDCRLKPPPSLRTRQEAIPADAVKQTPETDIFPPILHFSDWDTPVPMEGPVNTAGAEDSPFIMPDGETFFLFFTPDVTVPANEQLFDGVTGIWWSHLAEGTWTEPERILLRDIVAIDGAEFVQGDTMWFGSVRSRNYGEVDVYTAQFIDGQWANVVNAGAQLNQEYDIGEFHITADGSRLYFGRLAATKDIWVSNREENGWSNPQLVERVNTESGDEDQPFITLDDSELWFTGTSRLGYPGPSVFRSMMTDSGWGAPEEIISQFAAEPTLDDDGNIYFVHHFFTADMTMIEADIYVARKR